MVPAENQWTVKVEIAGQEVLFLSSDGTCCVAENARLFLGAHLLRVATGVLDSHRGLREVTDAEQLEKMS